MRVIWRVIKYKLRTHESSLEKKRGVNKKLGKNLYEVHPQFNLHPFDLEKRRF